MALHEIIFLLTYAYLTVLGFNDTSTLVGHFVSPREREKRDREDERGTEKKQEHK